MTMRTQEDDLFDERTSGIPPKGRLGASKNEMIGLLVALAIFAVIAVSFWYESRP